MRKLVETLLAAQLVLLSSTATAAQKNAQLRRLRDQLPEPVLAHYLRLIAQGRKGAAAVSNGVCTGCHLRVPSGTAAALAHPADLHLCENCGAYLVIPEHELPQAAAHAVTAISGAGRSRGRPRAVAVQPGIA